MVSLTSRPLNRRRRSFLYQLNRRLGGFQCWSDVLEERKIPSLCLFDVVRRIERDIPVLFGSDLEAVVLNSNVDFLCNNIYIYMLMFVI